MAVQSYSRTYALELRHVAQLQQSFAELGLAADILTDTRATLNRHGMLSHELATRPDALVPKTHELGNAIATGSIDVDAAISAVAKAQSRVAARESIVEMLTFATDIAKSTAMSMFRATGDDLMAVLDDEARAIGETATNAVRTIADITNDREALRSTPKVRQTWNDLSLLEPRLTAIQDLADQLRIFRIVPTPRNALPEEMHYLMPEKLTTTGQSGLRAKTEHAVWQLVRRAEAMPVERIDAPPTAEQQRGLLAQCNPGSYDTDSSEGSTTDEADRYRIDPSEIPTR